MYTFLLTYDDIYLNSKIFVFICVKKYGRKFLNNKIVNESQGEDEKREDTTSLVEGGKANDAILYVHSFHNFLTAATGTDKTKIRFYLASCTKKWIRPLTPLLKKKNCSRSVLRMSNFHCSFQIED